MQNLISEDRVIAEIMKIAAETLRAPEGKVTPDSSFVRDLGAESLDFLDIDYRMEQAFGIKMARHFFLEHVEEMYGEGAAIDEDGAPHQERPDPSADPVRRGESAGPVERTRHG